MSSFDKEKILDPMSQNLGLSVLDCLTTQIEIMRLGTPSFFCLSRKKAQLTAMHTYGHLRFLMQKPRPNVEKMGNENFGVERPRSFDHTNKNPKARSFKVSLLHDRDMGA
jgi:hypothetical protein